jgi:hypothetical protein
MSLFSNLDLANIAKEMGVSGTALSAAKAILPALGIQLEAKKESSSTTTLLWTDSNDNRVFPYESERFLLDGNQATPIIMSQIEDAAARTPTNVFFPTGWALSNAKLIPSGNGLTIAATGLGELYDIDFLTRYINLIRNGQSSGVSNDILTSNYTPGATTISVQDGGQAINSYLVVSGDGQSALVKVTAIVPNGPNYDISIIEIVAPGGVISVDGDVVSNFPGFSESQRESLTGSSILTGLASEINSGVNSWNNGLNSQLVQLKANIDSPTEITAAKNDADIAQASIASWNARPNTGSLNKYSDEGLDYLITVSGNRSSFIPTRVTQILTALGSVTQDPLGNYSGVGLYLLRFKSINLLINGADGTMHEVHGLTSVKGLFEAKVGNAMDKVSMFKNLLG